MNYKLNTNLQPFLEVGVQAIEIRTDWMMLVKNRGMKSTIDFLALRNAKTTLKRFDFRFRVQHQEKIST